MNGNVNYFLTGIFVVCLSMTGFAAFFWLSKTNDETEYTLYRIYFSESIAGLSENSKVKYNGVDVGNVKDISISNFNYRETIVTIEVLKDTPITEETYATLTKQSITGVSYIGLKTLIQFGKRIVKSPNEMYPVIKTSPSLFVEIDKTINDITLNFKSFVNRFEKIANDKNVDILTQILDNSSKMVKKINTNLDLLENVLTKSNIAISKVMTVIENLPELSEEFKDTLRNLNDLSGYIKGASISLNYAAGAVGDLFEKEFKKMLNNMNSTMNMLKVIGTNLESNPDMLLKGILPENSIKGE